MAFGGQTIKFISRSPSGDTDALGTRTLTETVVDVAGCRHRPLTPTGNSGAVAAGAEEHTEVGVSVATDWWKSTCPPDPAALAAQAADLIEVDGVRFVLIGSSNVFTDMAGKPFKVTLTSEQQSIG